MNNINSPDHNQIIAGAYQHQQPKTAGMTDPNPAKRLSVEAAKNGWIISRVREGQPPVNYVCANAQEGAAVVLQLITTGRVDLSNNSAVAQSVTGEYARALYHANQEVERLRTVLEHRQKEAIDTIAKLKLEVLTEANRRADAEAKLRTAQDTITGLEDRLKTAATAWDQGYGEGQKQIDRLTTANTLAAHDIAGLRKDAATAHNDGFNAAVKAHRLELDKARHDAEGDKRVINSLTNRVKELETVTSAYAEEIDRLREMKTRVREIVI